MCDNVLSDEGMRNLQIRKSPTLDQLLVQWVAD